MDRVNETGDEKLNEEVKPVDLGDLVGEQAAEAPAQEAAAPAGEPTGQEAKTQAEPKQGEDAKPEPTQPLELSDEQIAALPQDSQGFYKAMKTERGKRQDAEKLLKEAGVTQEQSGNLIKELTDIIKGAKTAQPQLGADAQSADAIDLESEEAFWKNPGGYLKALRESITGQVQGVSKTQRDQWLNTSQMVARSKHEDFDAAYSVFAQTAQQNPALMQQVLNSPDPGEAVYAIGKQMVEMTELSKAGGVSSLKEQIRAEIMKELGAEPGAKAAEDAIGQALPSAMASMRSVGAGNDSGAHPDGATPLGDLVPRQTA